MAACVTRMKNLINTSLLPYGLSRNCLAYRDLLVVHCKLSKLPIQRRRDAAAMPNTGAKQRH
jgi:hypothetical protein